MPGSVPIASIHGRDLPGCFPVAVPGEPGAGFQIASAADRRRAFPLRRHCLFGLDSCSGCDSLPRNLHYCSHPGTG
jgi:hypothetical protein